MQLGLSCSLQFPVFILQDGPLLTAFCAALLQCGWGAFLWSLPSNTSLPQCNQISCWCGLNKSESIIIELADCAVNFSFHNHQQKQRFSLGISDSIPIICSCWNLGLQQAIKTQQCGALPEAQPCLSCSYACAPWVRSYLHQFLF